MCVCCACDVCDVRLHVSGCNLKASTTHAFVYFLVEQQSGFEETFARNATEINNTNAFLQSTLQLQFTIAIYLAFERICKFYDA